MQKREYLVARYGHGGWGLTVVEINGEEMPNWNNRELWNVLGELGSEGWKLMQMAVLSPPTFILKRPKVQ